MAAAFQLPDPTPVERLPSSVEELEALRQADQAQMVEALEQYVQQRVATEVAHKVKELIEQHNLLRHRMFGRSSEAHAGQGRLFNEAELEAPSAPEDENTESTDTLETGPAAKKQPPRRRGKRKPLPPELPRVETVVDVPEHERQCDCGTPMVKIGEEVSEQLDIVPMKVRVIRTVRLRYGCPNGEHAPTVAPTVPAVLPRSHFSAGLLAMLLTVKYADGLPLNRFAKVLGRHGIELPRQSLARAVIATSKALQPLFNLARDNLLDSPVIHMDETPVQVLKEPDKLPSAQSYMWVQRGGPPKQPVILFDYDPSRSGQVPKQLLEGWQGYLMSDDYGGYNEIARVDGIEHLSCMAHAGQIRRGQTGPAQKQDQSCGHGHRLLRPAVSHRKRTQRRRRRAASARPTATKLAGSRRIQNLAEPDVATSHAPQQAGPSAGLSAQRLAETRALYRTRRPAHRQ